jgi:hypothetical protein
MTARRPRAKATDPIATPELDARIADAEAAAIVIWHGRRLAFAVVPERAAAIADRAGRNRLFTSYVEVVEALNPLRIERIAARTAAAAATHHTDLVTAVANRQRFDPIALAVEVARFLNASETVYYAALRRYLALIDIEQGDASVVDLWHVLRGTSWSHWFEARRLDAALRATGDGLVPFPPATTAPSEGSWAAAHLRLTSVASGTAGGNIAGALLGSLLSDPDWLERELAVPASEAAALADFGAFTRLYAMRRDAALLAYELRLYRTDDAALQRAYFAGLQGLQTGVAVPDPLYLREVDEPFASALRLRAEIGAGVVAEALRSRVGPGWWRSADEAIEVRALVDMPTHDDVVAQLGYDPSDWRPVLRQIRTQLIGEMSGYGGPNITTRAGTRKV